MNRGAWGATVHGVAKSQTQLGNKHTHICTYTHTCTHTYTYTHVHTSIDIMDPYDLCMHNGMRFDPKKYSIQRP